MDINSVIEMCKIFYDKEEFDKRYRLAIASMMCNLHNFGATTDDIMDEIDGDYELFELIMQ